MPPLVSILIPSFNAAAWLAESIQSALDQSWLRKEIIIVDDGSDDESLAVARTFGGSTIKVVSQQNQGASAARNRALRDAQGDYIQWLDSDDVLAADKIEKQMRAAETCGSKATLLAGAWGHFYFRTSKARFKPTALWCDLSPVEWLLRKMDLNLFMQPDCWLVSRELTDAAGPWDPTLWRDNDGEYFCRVVMASDGIRFIPDAVSYYRRSGCLSVSHVGQSPRKIESTFRSITLHIEYLLSLEDSDRTRSACLNFLQMWFLHFYPEWPEYVNALRQRARQLGGELQIPSLPLRYDILRKAFGWKIAKGTKRRLRNWKEQCHRTWDRSMHICGASSNT